MATLVDARKRLIYVVRNGWPIALGIVALILWGLVAAFLSNQVPHFLRNFAFGTIFVGPMVVINLLGERKKYPELADTCGWIYFALLLLFLIGITLEHFFHISRTISTLWDRL